MTVLWVSSLLGIVFRLRLRMEIMVEPIFLGLWLNGRINMDRSFGNLELFCGCEVSNLV